MSDTERAGQRLSVAILSPHLDDAALSLGATIAMLSRHGVDVHVITVFAGDASHIGPASEWDSFRHTGSAQEVFLARREEDLLACAALGARPTWLDHVDDLYDMPRDRDQIWGELRTAIGAADVVLVPGYPLLHADHRFVAALVHAHLAELPCVVQYCELPYAILPRTLWARIRDRRWTRPAASRADRAARRAACEHFRHEIAQFGFSARWAQRCGSPVSLESVSVLHGHLPPPLAELLG